MDRLNNFRTKIQTYCEQQAQIRFSPPTLKYKTVFDTKSDNYLLVLTGHDNQKHVYGVDLHLSIEGDKVLLLEDNTDWDVFQDLEAAGIAREDLVDATQSYDPLSSK
jgi:hypothetical protein